AVADTSTAETKDAGSSPGLAARTSRAAASIADRRRPALDRSFHAGVVEPAARPGADHSPRAADDGTAGLSGALECPGLPYPADAGPLRAPPGAADGRGGHRGETPPGGGGAAYRDQSRWGTPVCGRADQDRPGGGLAPGAGGPLCADGAAPAACHSRDAPGRPYGAAGSTGRGQGGGATGGGTGTDLSPRPAPSRGAPGCVGGVARPGAARQGGGALPAGGAAAGDVYVQACAAPRYGVSVVAAEHPAAVPSTDCADVGDEVP